LGLLSEKESIAYKILTSRGAKLAKLKQALIDYVGCGSKSDVTSADMSPRLARTIENASQEALRSGARLIGSEHLLSALISQKDAVGARLLECEGIILSEIKSDLAAYLGATPQSHSQKGDEEQKKPRFKSLSLYGKDITSSARLNFIDPLIGRDTELQRLVRILCRRQKNNPCLIGEPGVGKTALVEGLASLMARGGVPDELKDKRIISLDLPSMLAGAKYRGEFEDRMKNIIEDVKRAGDVILFIDEIHVITGAGAAEGAIDAANILKPPLSRGEIRVIGATTIEEYRAKIEKDSALERRFQPIILNEPSENEAIEILFGLRSKYELHHSVKISDEALRASVKLSSLYIHDRFLPDKAIDLIDEAAAKLRLLSVSNRETQAIEAISYEKEQAVLDGRFSEAGALSDKERRIVMQAGTLTLESEDASASAEPPTLTAEDIAAVISEQTGIPCASIASSETDELMLLEEKLSKQVIGQSDAIKKIASTVRRSRTGVRQKNRPCGSFLFLGSTGVGKTELCFALCSALFKNPSSFIKLDMSEYMEKHSVSKLIGAPPGYVGYGEGSFLCERVRRNPYSLILLDEIEKAHPDVLNLLLQILENGVLSDSSGKRIDFKNTILIMTSNLTSDSSKRSHRILSFGEEERERDDPRELDALKSFFKPEFLNRIDEIIFFNELGEQELCLIAEKMLTELTERVRENGITLNISPEIAPLLAKKTKKLKLGARPLRREIINGIENPLAELILAKGKNTEACASVSNGEIILS
jgi:ATP-dependent Clp protease ATP-binding subunit ClpC